MGKEIKPLIGFDNIKFGMTMSEVKDIMGKPDSIEEDQNYTDNEDEKEDLTTVFYYDELDISMSFDKEENYRLTEVSFEGDQFGLGDLRVGMSKEEAFSAAADAGLGECEEDYLGEDADSDNMELYTYEAKNVSLWFADDLLDTIQIGPGMIDDDTIAWPK